MLGQIAPSCPIAAARSAGRRRQEGRFGSNAVAGRGGRARLGGRVGAAARREIGVATRAPFLGTYLNKVDRKGRVSVPAPFRQVLARDDFQGIVCFASPKVAAVQGCGLEVMTDLMESMDEAFDHFTDEQEAMAAALFSGSHQLAWDSGGRVQLPETLLQHAGIGEEAVFAGLGKFFRIWEPSAFEAFQAGARARFDEKKLSLSLRSRRED